MIKCTFLPSLFSLLFLSLQSAEQRIISTQPKQTESSIGNLTKSEVMAGLCIVALPVNTAFATVYATLTSPMGTPTVTAICKTTASLYISQTVSACAALVTAKIAQKLCYSTDTENKKK